MGHSLVPIAEATHAHYWHSANLHDPCVVGPSFSCFLGAVTVNNLPAALSCVSVTVTATHKCPLAMFPGPWLCRLPDWARIPAPAVRSCGTLGKSLLGPGVLTRSRRVKTVPPSPAGSSEDSQEGCRHSCSAQCLARNNNLCYFSCFFS